MHYIKGKLEQANARNEKNKGKGKGQQRRKRVLERRGNGRSIPDEGGGGSGGGEEKIVFAAVRKGRGHGFSGVEPSGAGTLKGKNWG